MKERGEGFLWYRPRVAGENEGVAAAFAAFGGVGVGFETGAEAGDEQVEFASPLSGGGWGKSFKVGLILSR